MKLTKILSGTLSAALLGTMLCSTAFAAELENGSYTGEIHFLNGNGTGSYSMCDPIFAHEADITLTDDGAELTFYVAYPVPSFPDQGTDGTIKDVTFTVNETPYTAESDIDTKPVKLFDTAGALFGINEGDELTTQVLTVDLPRDVLDDLEAGTVAASAYVNVVMNTTQNFFVQVTNVQAAGAGETEETKSMEITADVEAAVSQPSYTVTVPGSLGMGKLSAETDNKQSYNVEVAASDLNGTLSVAAPGEGSLSSGDNQLAFTNSFGTQTVTEDTEGTSLAGEIGVSAAEVAAAAAGNYSGTTTFSITYAGN